MHTRKLVVITIPPDVSFDALNLTTDPATGELDLDWSVVRKIMDANDGLTLAEEQIQDLLVAWYGCLRLQGYRHPVAEQILSASDLDSVFNSDHLPPSKSIH